MVPEFWGVQLIRGVGVTAVVGVTVGIVVGVGVGDGDGTGVTVAPFPIVGVGVSSGLDVDVGISVVLGVGVMKAKTPPTCKPTKTTVIIKTISGKTLNNLFHLGDDEGSGRDFCGMLGEGECGADVDDKD